MANFTEHDKRSIVHSAELELRKILDLAFMSETEVIYEAYGSMFTIPLERKFADVESMQRYVDQLLALDWVKEKWPERSATPIVVKAKRGGNRLQASQEMKRGVSQILIPPHLDGGRNSWAMRETALLHEIAHHFSKNGHGEDFVATLIDFLSRLIGPYVGLLFQIEVSKAQEELASQKKKG